MNKKQKIKEMAEDLQAAEEKAGKIILKETRKFLEENARYNRKTDYIKAHVKSCFELAAETLYKAGWRKCGRLDCEKIINNFVAEIRLQTAKEIIGKVKTAQAECIADEAIIGLLMVDYGVYDMPDFSKDYIPVSVSRQNSPVCPICGGDTDETEHGRQYCYDCKEKLEEKK